MREEATRPRPRPQPPRASARSPFPMQHSGPAWFRDLFGFDESSTWGDNVNHFQMDGDTLVCRTAPQFPRQFVGRFECPSVAELRSKLAAAQGAAAPSAGLSFAHLAAPAGVGPLHYEPSNAGAVFQAASQFNCLEMTGPNVSPTAGVGIYINDRTQGPACALACPAATVYRNYLVQHEGNTGQHPVQIDNLKEVGVVVGNNGGRYWVMQNGYAMPVGRGSLAELAARLRTEPNLVEQAEAALRVGVHWETSVAPPLEHRVCQVYASALPCAYARGPPESDWEPFARLVLRAAYEATLAVGAVRSLESGGARVKCYLTALGGGVFGNRYEWIRDAILDALDRYQGWPLDVVLVHFGSHVDANWAQDLIPREPALTTALTQSGGASRGMATPHASMPYTAPALGSAVGDFLRGSSSSTLEPRRSSSTGSSHPSELNSRRKESCCVPTRQSSLPTPSELEQRFARLANGDGDHGDLDDLHARRQAELVSGAGFGTTPRQLSRFDYGVRLPNREHVYHGKEGVRQRVLLECLERLEEASPTARYHKLAQQNLRRWSQVAARARAGLPPTPAPTLNGASCTVRVLPGDWGQVTLDMTREYGVIFASLNMANAYSPGGDYTFGAVAQEENMFRRTDCHFSLECNLMDIFRADGRSMYSAGMTSLISGGRGRVYLDKRPRVCIRGPEDSSRADLGYPWLADDEVFPFYELRAAAVDLRGEQAFDANEAARRVAAQLDTLIEHGVRHAVLSAFGCGSFRNPADQVARIYRQELLKRATQFDVIAFAIFDAGYGPDNFMPFEMVFDGRPAGTTSYPFMRQTEALPTLSSTTAAVPAPPPAASSHTPRNTHQVQDRSGLMSSSPLGEIASRLMSSSPLGEIASRLMSSSPLGEIASRLMSSSPSAENAPWPLTKSSPPPTAASPSCILVTTGAMNPLHKGHVAMLHQAAARVRQVGFHVCAAYLSPSHDGYVQPKARNLGTIGLSAAFRLALARKAVADDPLVAVASWEAEFPGSWPDFPAVCQAAQTEPRIASLAHVQRVFYVCGTDHASKCGLWQGKRDYGVVVVPRAGDALGRESPSDGVYLAAPAAGEVATFSSSGLRAALARHDEGAIASMMSPQAARMLLRPTAAEHAAFASDYRQLGVAPLMAASVSSPAFPAEDASDYRQLANRSHRSH